MSSKKGVQVVRNKSTNKPVVVSEEIAQQASRAYSAHRMKIAGDSWESIADKLEYPSAKAAIRDVYLYRREASSVITEMDKENYIAEEMERLDALQRAVWDDAMTGDVRAVGSALRVIETRMKLLGLEAFTGAAVQQTVVVTGTTDEFVESLRKAAQHG